MESSLSWCRLLEALCVPLLFLAFLLRNFLSSRYRVDTFIEYASPVGNVIHHYTSLVQQSGLRGLQTTTGQPDAEDGTTMKNKSHTLELVQHDKFGIDIGDSIIKKDVQHDLILNHVYKNESSHVDRPRDAGKCAVYERDQAFSGASDLSRYPWRPGVRSKKDPQALYGTGWTQEFIWNHQHPESCHGKKYLAMRKPRSGMGSQLHVAGQAFALAIHLGRIFVWHADAGDAWYDPSVCPGKVSWECWLLSPTNCRPPHKSPDIQMVDFPPVAGSFGIHSVPMVFHELLRCSPMKTNDWFYWWRAQATAYIVRFNQVTRSMIDQMRGKLLHAVHGGSDELHAVDVLPAGTISSHVRHGDKGIEAALFPFKDYAHEMERLVSGDQTIPVLYAEVAESNNTFVYPKSSFDGRTLFVSTEDQTVIDEAKEFIRGKQSWTLFYCKVSRPNVGVWSQLKQKGVKKEVLEAFVNLELALEADAFVCTISSNWCRLIDELRMTVGGKVGAPYVSLTRGGYPRGTPCPKSKPECYLDF